MVYDYVNDIIPTRRVNTGLHTYFFGRESRFKIPLFFIIVRGEGVRVWT